MVVVVVVSVKRKVIKIVVMEFRGICFHKARELLIQTIESRFFYDDTKIGSRQYSLKKCIGVMLTQ